MRCSDKWTASDVIYLVDPKITERFIWKLAFEDDTFTRRGLKYFGFDGGTIHQLIDKIQTRQRELNLKYD